MSSLPHRNFIQTTLYVSFALAAPLVAAQGPSGSVTYGPDAGAAQIPTTGGIALILLALLLVWLALRTLRSREGLRRILSVSALFTASAMSMFYGMQVVQVEALPADVTVDGAECTTDTTELYDPSLTGTRLVSNCPNEIVINDLTIEGCDESAPESDTCTTSTVLSNSESCGLPSCEDDEPPPIAGACQGGANKLSTSPGGDMVVCDDPLDQTCEQDVETLCPVGMQLCTHLQVNERNAGWDYPVGNPNPIVVGEIYCRQSTANAGHFTLGPYDGVSNLGQDAIPFNCGFGSSRSSCPAGYGCNEEEVQAACCFPTASCGNGVVDSPEEECDDGNSDESDACLNSCVLRVKPNC